jgi:hypothetical protein
MRACQPAGEGYVEREGVKVFYEVFGGTLVTIEGGGHAPHVRDPVRFNLLLREFIGSLEPRRPDPPDRTWTRASRRRPAAGRSWTSRCAIISSSARTSPTARAATLIAELL